MMRSTTTPDNQEISAISGSDSSGSDDGCSNNNNIGLGGRSDRDVDKSNAMTAAEVEMKRKRQALMIDDDISSAAAPERQPLRPPAACRRRPCADEAGEPGGGSGSDENDAAAALCAARHLDARAVAPKPKAARPPKKGGSRTKCAQTTTAATTTTTTTDRPPLPSKRPRTGRGGKPKASDEQPEFWENYQGVYKVAVTETPASDDANERVIALSYLALEDSAVELWPGGARVRIFLDLRSSGPLSGVLYLRASVGAGIEDCAGAALLVYMVLRGKVTVKLSAASGSGSGGGGGHTSNNNNNTNSSNPNGASGSSVFSASAGSVLQVPPRSRYSITCRSDTGAQLSFLHIPAALVAARVGAGGGARRLDAAEVAMVMTEVAKAREVCVWGDAGGRALAGKVGGLEAKEDVG